jgi:hypothetical protein
MGLRRCVITVILLLGCSALAWPQSDSIPLGDVARQKPARKARRVITDDDLPRHPSPPPDAAAPTSDDKDAPSKPADGADAKPADGDMAATRKTLEDLLVKEQALNAEIANLEKQAGDSPVDSRRDVLLDVIRNRNADLENARASITATEQHLLELLRKDAKAPDSKPKDSAGDSANTEKTAANQPPAEVGPDSTQSQSKD